MFGWVKSLSSKQIRQDKSKNRSFSIKRETSTTSLSSIFDLETSENLDFEDTFSIPKDSIISRGNKQILRRIISMFQRRSKDVSIDDNRRNRSIDSLLDESTENAMDKETEDSSLFDDKMEKVKRRRKGVVKRIFTLKRKKKQFKGKPLDDYAKRKLRISRDLGWELTSSASSSSSLVNEEATFSASSPITKINPKAKNSRISSKAEHDRVTVYRNSLLFTREDVENLFEKRFKSTEDLKKHVDGNSSVLSDSGICESGDSSNLNDSREQSRSMVDNVDKLRVIKFSHSEDCVAHLLANVKSCGKCALSCDASRSRGKTDPSEFPAKVSSRTANHSEELRVVKRVRSADCIPSYIKSPLKNAERSPSVATCSGLSNLDVANRSNDFLESHRSIEENLSTRTRSWISKSAVELREEDPLCCQDEIAEFSSLNDLRWTSLQHSGNVDKASSKAPNEFSVNEKLKVTSDEESVVKSMDVQRDSTSFDYEDEFNNENRCFSSLNASYVITMYV